MSIMDIILLLGSISAALLAVYKLVKIAVKPIMSGIEIIKDAVADIEELQQNSNETYMSCLKLTIMSNDMPIEERLNAGEKYIKHDGNGAVKAKYHCLAKEYENEQKIEES